MNYLRKNWGRLKRSWGRRFREWRLPRGYRRLGTRYGGWWLDFKLVSPSPLLVDCGLGEDISFPTAFLARFGGRVVGVEPNPRSLAFCREHCPAGMEIRPCAFWKTTGEQLTFHLPRAQAQLPKGADGVSGSLVSTHEYVGGGEQLTVFTLGLADLLVQSDREECDVLKLDIEGAEYEVLEALCRSGELRRSRQLLVEFHHRVTHHTTKETAACVRTILAAGFQLIYVESRNHVFRRCEVGSRAK